MLDVMASNGTDRVVCFLHTPLRRARAEGECPPKNYGLVGPPILGIWYPRGPQR